MDLAFTECPTLPFEFIAIIRDIGLNIKFFKEIRYIIGIGLVNQTVPSKLFYCRCKINPKHCNNFPKTFIDNKSSSACRYLA